MEFDPIPKKEGNLNHIIKRQTVVFNVICSNTKTKILNWPNLIEI